MGRALKELKDGIPRGGTEGVICFGGEERRRAWSGLNLNQEEQKRACGRATRGIKSKKMVFI